MKITVFGGASPRPGEPLYEEALKLGRLLGQAGHTVLTGGYMGTMEAVSKGAAEAGAHVIGVTCQEIENWRPTRPNEWVKEEWREHTLYDRMVRLMDGGDAALALPGGPGTLAEISMLWNRMLIQSVPQRPLILISPSWKEVMQTFIDEFGLYIRPGDHEYISYADTIEEAVHQVSNYVPNITRP